jgi:thiol:disulfide interchange protein DsbA
MLTQAKSRVRAYKVRGTPEIIVNGKYRISSTKAGGFSGMLKVAEFLIDKERGLTAK